MIDSLLRSVEQFILVRENANRWKAWYGPALLILFIALPVATIFVHNSPLQIVVGGLCGAGIFLAGYIVWYANFPIKYNMAMDVKGNYPLLFRRRIALIVCGSWFVLLLLFATHIPSPLAGAFTVAIILTCWHLGSASESERAYLNEIGDEWIEAETARKRAIEEEKKRRPKLFSRHTNDEWDDNEEEENEDEWGESYEQDWDDDDVSDDNQWDDETPNPPKKPRRKR